ncbi:MAG TPA: ThiF family adenylyltransferase [Drouetiella sp.]
MQQNCSGTVITGVGAVSSSEQKRTNSQQQNEVLPGFDLEARERLSHATALIAGVQSYGAVAARYLTEAGVGKIVLVDEDPKALSSAFKNVDGISNSEVVCKATRMDGHDADQLFKPCDLIVDGLNNWQEKLLVSDVCMQIGKPLIHAGGAGFRFQVFTMRPSRSACLRCVFPLAGIDDVPLQPLEQNSIAAVLGMVGAWQSVEAIKLLAKVGATQGNELTKIDFLSGEFETIRGLDPRTDCPDCGRAPRN